MRETKARPGIPLALLIGAIALGFAAPSGADEAAAPEKPSEAKLRLGEELFRELRFTNPGTNVQSSCAGCHAAGTDPVVRPVVPHRSPDGLRLAVRNAPALAGRGSVGPFVHDGIYADLAGLAEAVVAGRAYGWLPDERERAAREVQAILVMDTGEGRPGGATYTEMFVAAYDIDPDKLSPEESLKAASRAVADYVGSLDFARKSPYDAFAGLNRINVPGSHETPAEYAGRVFGRLGNQLARQLVKRPPGFSPDAFRGYRDFMRTDGEASVGNCVACHVPPDFTDGSFRNAGVAQAEWARVHGKSPREAVETFAGATTPSADTYAVPSAGAPGQADLGHWNFASSADAEPLRWAFRVPSLRNLRASRPYFHDGSAETVEAAVREHVRLAELGRAGDLPGLDPELTKIRLAESDIAPIVEFLETLNDVPPEEFRELLIHAERHIPAEDEIE